MRAPLPRNLDTSLLRTFVTVARGGSMTAAGIALHLTQGAISQQIKRLEACFDQPLFTRDPRGLTLTAAGIRLLDRADALIAMNDRIWADMHEAAFGERVRVGVPYDLVGTYLGGILKAYAQAYPQIEIDLACMASPELIDALGRGDIDLALVEQRVWPDSKPDSTPASTQPDGECLRVEALRWVGARGGRAYGQRPLPVSMVSDTCVFQQAVDDALRANDIAWRTVFQNGNFEATVSTVRMDMAVTAWLPSTVPAELQMLPAHAGLPSLPDFAIHLHVAPGPLAGCVDAMCGFVRDAFATERCGDEVEVV